MNIDQSLIEGVTKFLQAVGLPVVFCIWLMVRVEKRQDAQTEVLQEISKTMAAVLEHLREEN